MTIICHIFVLLATHYRFDVKNKRERVFSFPHYFVNILYFFLSILCIFNKYFRRILHNLLGNYYEKFIFPSYFPFWAFIRPFLGTAPNIRRKLPLSALLQAQFRHLFSTFQFPPSPSALGKA